MEGDEHTNDGKFHWKIRRGGLEGELASGIGAAAVVVDGVGI